MVRCYNTGPTFGYERGFGRRFASLAFSAGTLVLALLTAGCGSLDLGDPNLTQQRQVPDPVLFATNIHPRLQSACGAPTCHGRAGTFSLSKADTVLPADFEASHPIELPQPFKSDYYNLLIFCDLDTPTASQVIIWGTGQEPAHPGGSVMTPEIESELIDWLETNEAD